MLAVMQDNWSSDLWVASAANLDEARQATSGEQYPAVFWTAEGRLLTRGSGPTVTMGADGGRCHRSAAARGHHVLAVGLRVGRYLVYMARKGTASDVWWVEATATEK